MAEPLLRLLDAVLLVDPGAEGVAQTRRGKAVAGLDEVTRAALDAAQAQRAEEDGAAPSNVVALAGRRGRTR